MKFLIHVATLVLIGITAVQADANCTAISLTDDSTINISDYRGKTVYLDFWASWCGPCRASFPFMNQLQREIGEENLTIIAISVDENINDANAFLKKIPAEFTVALDSSGKCPKIYGVTAMPSSFVIGPKGDILYSHRGFRKSDPEKLSKKIKTIIEQTK